MMIRGKKLNLQKKTFVIYFFYGKFIFDYQA